MQWTKYDLCIRCHRMRNYAPRHTLAVLRGIIGHSQQELADLVGRSPRTIQAIEIGRLPLSEDLAVRVSHETGVSMQWLLGGDLDAMPQTAMSDRPFDKAIFDDTRSSIAAGADPNPLTANLVMEDGSHSANPLPLMRQMFERINSLHHPHMDYWLASVLSSIFAAQKAGRARLAIYRLLEFDKAMRKEFGQRIDGEFVHDALVVFENSLVRIKGAELLVAKSGAVSSRQSLSDGEGAGSRDLLDDRLLNSGLADDEVESIWASLNGIGDRTKTRKKSLQKIYETTMEQIIGVFAASRAISSGANQPAPAETVAQKTRQTGKPPRKPHKK